MKIVPLQTERLELSAPRVDDIPQIVRLANDFEVVRTLARLPHPYGIEDARYFLNEVVPNEPNWRVMRKSDAALLGFVGLTPVEPGSCVELGYWFGRAYWRQGYATEAAQAVVAHAFSHRELQTIQSGHFTDNPASGRVLAKIGFQETGRSRRHSLAAGAALEHVDMALPRSAWQAGIGKSHG